ncbi:MAG TPA: penicillin-insensitive murein endopeptidase [Thermoanaerobaculia bacterium]|nr:penicillin-insensitive murein endopeptidase [Thermoanaerobaculia bacterium]
MAGVRTVVALACLALLGASAAPAPSTCFGTPAKGRLVDGCRLPASGANFAAYSAEGVRAGRTYVHCTVAAIVADAYVDAARQLPGVRFVYGETGKAHGGDFSPHKSHQNGLSVDFFVPVRDAKGRPGSLTFTSRNRWGYDLEFDKRGRLGSLAIDFEAVGVHLLALAKAAEQRGLGIRRIYFDTALQEQLRKTSIWPRLEALPFSTTEGWWRHDEHYHVDFAVPCRPL